MSVTDFTKPRILVIDRDQSSIDELTAVLSDRDYEVTTAGTGREGLEQVSKQAFDIIITDVLLPDISGLDLLSKIREKDSDVKVYVMGAQVTTAVILESVNRGAYDVLYKPFVSSIIVPMIEYILSHERPFHLSREKKTTA